eukprot:200011_1
MCASEFRSNVIDFCVDNKQPYEYLHELYETIGRFDEFCQLSEILEDENRQKVQSCLACCYSEEESETYSITVQKRDVSSKKLVLHWQGEKNEEQSKMEITSQPYTVTIYNSNDPKNHHKFLQKGNTNILSNINDQNV